MALPLMALAGPVIEGIFGLIDKTVEDKDEANKIKAAISARQHEMDLTALKGQVDIILAEANGSATQRNWRPHLMYLIMGLLVFNGVVVPLVEAIFGVKLPILEAWESIPSDMWKLLMLGVGGYVAGRSAEKVAQNFKRD